MWMDCTDVATLILGNEGPGPGNCEVFWVEAQGTAVKIWTEKYQPDWRMLFGPASCTVSAFGIGEDGSLEMEVESESIISVVDEEECNEFYVVNL